MAPINPPERGSDEGVAVCLLCSRTAAHSTELKEFIPSPRIMMKGSGSNEFGLAVLGWENGTFPTCRWVGEKMRAVEGAQPHPLG